MEVSMNGIRKSQLNGFLSLPSPKIEMIKYKSKGCWLTSKNNLFYLHGYNHFYTIPCCTGSKHNSIDIATTWNCFSLSVTVNMSKHETSSRELRSVVLQYHLKLAVSSFMPRSDTPNGVIVAAHNTQHPQRRMQRWECNIWQHWLVDSAIYCSTIQIAWSTRALSWWVVSLMICIFVFFGWVITTKQSESLVCVCVAWFVWRYHHSWIHHQGMIPDAQHRQVATTSSRGNAFSRRLASATPWCRRWGFGDESSGSCREIW